MIKDLLNKRNRYKHVICRTRDGLSLVELVDRVTADGVMLFRFAVAHTDCDGNSTLDDGVVLNRAELVELGKSITEALGAGLVREGCPLTSYEKEFPAQAQGPKYHLW